MTVSVIIPIYNVSKFIDRGIQNVLSQTFQDFEIILVDDGSYDESLKKCKKWASKDSRIKVLHQENMGAGAARNLGLENAEGEFIYFFDIDDEIDQNLLEYNVNIMRQKKADMVIFGYKSIETTFRSTTSVCFPQTYICSNNEFRDIFIEECVLKVNGFPWNKFYRKSFLNKYRIRFENQRIQQDEVFNLNCYRHLECAYFSSKVLYKYYIYEKGNTRSNFISDRFEIYQSVRSHFENLITFWKIDDYRLRNYLNKRFYCDVKQCLTFNMALPSCTWSNKEKKKEIGLIMSNPLTIQAFCYAEKNIRSIEDILYRKICKTKSPTLLKLHYRLFNILHNIRKKVK